MAEVQMSFQQWIPCGLEFCIFLYSLWMFPCLLPGPEASASILLSLVTLAYLCDCDALYETIPLVEFDENEPITAHDTFQYADCHIMI